MDDLCRRRHRLLENLQPLRLDFNPGVDADTGQVAAGTRQIGNEPSGDRIAHDRDDRDRGGGRHKGGNEIVEVRDDDVRLAAHDLGRERRKQLRRPSAE